MRYQANVWIEVDESDEVKAMDLGDMRECLEKAVYLDIDTEEYSESGLYIGAMEIDWDSLKPA